MSARLQDLDDVLGRVRHPGRRVTPPPQTVAFPGSARYELIRQALQDDPDITYALIAEEFTVTIKEVRKIAEQEGLERATPQNQSTYCKERRLILSDMIFRKIEDLIVDVEDGQELQRVVSAYGTAVDKRRLEDGEVTSRTETVSREDARTSLDEKLKQLRERKQEGTKLIEAIEQRRQEALPTTTYTVLNTDDDAINTTDL